MERKNKNKTVIFDIDDTISRPGNRALLLEGEGPVDWDLFYSDSFEDEPIEALLEYAKICSVLYDLVFITSRSERVRGKTAKWLDKHIGVLSYTLHMRPETEMYTLCEDLKPALLKAAGIDPRDVLFAIDDNASILRAWERVGIETTLLVGGLK
jgi:hypothetical protein